MSKRSGRTSIDFGINLARLRSAARKHGFRRLSDFVRHIVGEWMRRHEEAWEEIPPPGNPAFKKGRKQDE